MSEEPATKRRKEDGEEVEKEGRRSDEEAPEMPVGNWGMVVIYTSSQLCCLLAFSEDGNAFCSSPTPERATWGCRGDESMRTMQSMPSSPS